MALMGYHPAIRTNIEDDIIKGGIPAAKDRIKRLEEQREKARDHWQHAVDSQAKYYNNKHQPLILKRNDLVGLSTKNLRLKGVNRKLAPKYIRPFRVLSEVGSLAYRIALPKMYSRLYNVFPITLLEP